MFTFFKLFSFKHQLVEQRYNSNICAIYVLLLLRKYERGKLFPIPIKYKRNLLNTSDDNVRKRIKAEDPVHCTKKATYGYLLLPADRTLHRWTYAERTSTN